MRATSVKARRPVVDIIGRIADTLWMSSFRACSVLDSSPFIALILSCRSSFSFSWIRVSSSWFWRAFLSSGKNMYTLVLCAVIPTCVSFGWPKHFVTFYCRVIDTPRPISTSQFLKTFSVKRSRAQSVQPTTNKSCCLCDYLVVINRQSTEESAHTAHGLPWHLLSFSLTCCTNFLHSCSSSWSCFVALRWKEKKHTGVVYTKERAPLIKCAIVQIVAPSHI